MDFSKAIQAVYLVQCEDLHVRLGPIAIRPTFKADLASWEDTGEGTVINIKKVDFVNIESDLPEKIELLTNDTKKIFLSKMTLKLFNQHVKAQAAGHPIFHSDAEVQNYYLQTNFNYYGP